MTEHGWILPEGSKVLYTADGVRERVRELGRDISAHYRGSSPLLMIGLLKGSFVFLADLARTLDIPVEIEFMVVSSYGERKSSTGEVTILHDARTSLRGRHVLVVEDIIDSGTTLARLVPQLRARDPESLEICSLLHKRRPSAEGCEARWIGFEAPNHFLVGYGLDFAEEYRQLPFIAAI